tara:strand:- start:12606 stop:13748 length:1143 start_codon:yes stop_codon:yes gene_type:complete
MRILLVSMNSLHFRRWASQLKDSGHEVFWFDILDMGYIPQLSWMQQITDWKRSLWKSKGRTFVKKNFPGFYTKITDFTDKKVDFAFAKAMTEVQPDVVHSFVLYQSCVPILEIMQKHAQVKWIYSSWGSDLFYFKAIRAYRKDIEAVLPWVDYMFSDCARDQRLATEMGFAGKFFGVFPGGGGFDFDLIAKYEIPLEDRKLILIKGYQGRSGRAVPVLQAINRIAEQLTHYEILVFGADPEVLDVEFEPSLNITVLPKTKFLAHDEILKLMSKSLIYIGNSNSDGLPNTLLEAICCGAFPIQSNPGGATAEVVLHQKNGLLIENCEDANEIARLLQTALSSKKMLQESFVYNVEKLKPNYEYKKVRKKVLKTYSRIGSEV